jgi:hypothetical protein
MYPSPHLYFTWGGQIGSDGAGVDIWQTGVRVGHLLDNTAPVQPDDTALADLYDSILAPFHSDINIGISQGAVLNHVKCASVDTSGHNTADVSQHNGTATPGPVTTDRGGVQDSIVLSLWSGTILGRANYGRLYMPWNGIPVRHQDGKISSAAAGNFAIRAATFMFDLDAWMSTNVDVDSQVLIFSKVGTGVKKAPALVRVGDVPDTQRRRRNRIAESYSAVTL